MSFQTVLVLIASTIGLVLIGYVVLTTLFRALNRPSLLLPWKRKSTIADLQAKGEQLLAEPLSSEDRLAVERALNTLRIPETRSLTGPWSTSDPIDDAGRDINGVWSRVRAASESRDGDE